MKLITIIIGFILVFTSCQNNQRSNQQIIGYGGKTNGQFDCGYVFNKDNILIKNVCQHDNILNGYLLEYFANGLLSSVQYYRNDTLQQNHIIYHPNGIVKQILPYIDGNINGESYIFYPNGLLKAINLFEDDSIYFVRIYSDSSRFESFKERLLPLVIINTDSVKVGDSILITVKFPLSSKYGIKPNIYDLNFDRYPAELLKGKKPYASKKIKLTGDNIEIKYSSTTPSHDQFYCYITDALDSIVSPTVFREMYFLEQK